MLGRYLAQGAASTCDPVEARLWLERAVAQGVEEAQEDIDALPTEEIVPSRSPGATDQLRASTDALVPFCDVEKRAT